MKQNIKFKINVTIVIIEMILIAWIRGVLSLSYDSKSSNYNNSSSKSFMTGRVI